MNAKMARPAHDDLPASNSTKTFTFPASHSGQSFNKQITASTREDRAFLDRPHMKRVSPVKIGVNLLVADFVLLFLTGMAAFTGFVQTKTAGLGALDCAPLWVVPILTVWTFTKRDLYDHRTTLQPIAWRQIVLGWCHDSGLLLLAAVAWSVVASRNGSHSVGVGATAGLVWSWVLAFMVTGLAGSFAIRSLWPVVRLRLVGRGQVLVHTRAVVVGTGSESEQIVSKLRNDPGAGLEVVGALDDGSRHRGERASVRGVTVLGGLRDMVRVERRSDAALVEAERLPVKVCLALDAVLRTYLHRPARSVADQPRFEIGVPHTFEKACARQTSRGDPRLTRVDALFRRHSLDELLREDAVDFYVARSRVKPGIAGRVPVNGWRVELDTREKLQRRVELKLAYADCWSLFLDLHILWRTLRCVVCDSHAY